MRQLAPRRVGVRGAVAAAAIGAVLAAAGCARLGTGETQPTSEPSTGGAVTTPADPGATTRAAPSTTKPADGGTYTVTYNWKVPSTKATVTHTNKTPVTSPPLPPLPYLVGIYTGDHSTEDPAYARISFYFRGAFPSYNIQYVKSVLSEGQGTPIPLQGNAFLRIGFVGAQAHDNDGKSTVKDVAATHIGFGHLVSYGPAGDFEGYLSYGLGIQVAPGSDQAPTIRVGELKKTDGNGGFIYVVAVDVHNG
jgi:hypothetical protein